MLGYHPVAHMDTQWNLKVLPKIRVKETKFSSEDIEIIAAHPDKAWNRVTGVMCSPTSRRLPDHVIGSVALRFKQSGAILSVAFKAPALYKTGISVQNDFEDVQFVIALRRSSNHGQARHRLEEQGPSLAAEVTDENDNSYSASVEVLKVLRDVVFIIEVSVGSTKRRQPHRPLRSLPQPHTYPMPRDPERA